jgi:dimethylargininase
MNSNRPARALVRRPGPRLAHGLVSHIARQEVDLPLAFAQWHGYVDALVANGWAPVEVEPADECPDAVFVEDPVVVYGDVAVLARSGAPERRAEVAGVERAVRAAGYRVARIEEPGTLDGGDVLAIGSTVYVGLTDRTNKAGIRQLAAYIDAKVVPVAVRGVLHLKSAVTALPDGTVIGHSPLAADRSAFPDFLPAPEESGAHVVPLGGDRVLLAASAPATAGLLRQCGFQPVVVDISEFEKLEGCVTCLSVRMRA